jgi:hypothetical protein
LHTIEYGTARNKQSPPRCRLITTIEVTLAAATTLDTTAVVATTTTTVEAVGAVSTATATGALLVSTAREPYLTLVLILQHLKLPKPLKLLKLLKLL